MYLLGVNTTTNGSLSPTGNYVMWSGCLGSPRHKGQIPAELGGNYVTLRHYKNTRETLAHKSIYCHLTRMVTVDEIINMNASKAPQEAKTLMLMLAAVATQMQHECIKGALVLHYKRSYGFTLHRITLSWYYHDTEKISPNPAPLMLGARLSGDKYWLYESLVWLRWVSTTPDTNQRHHQFGHPFRS